MDFWASLEHKIYYKFEGQAPEYISRELKECADMVSALDDKMLSLNEAILECLKEGGEKPVPEKTEEVDAEIIENPNFTQPGFQILQPFYMIETVKKRKNKNT